MKDAMARRCAIYAAVGTSLLPGTIRLNHQNEAQSRNSPNGTARAIGPAITTVQPL